MVMEVVGVTEGWEEVHVDPLAYWDADRQRILDSAYLLPCGGSRERAYQLHFALVLDNPDDAFEMAAKVREFWHERGLTTHVIESTNGGPGGADRSFRFAVHLEHGAAMDFGANNITASVSVTSACSWSANDVANKAEEP